MNGEASSLVIIRADGISVTPMPTFPEESILIFSAGSALVAVAKTIPVELFEFVKVASAIPKIEAPTNIASVPPDSKGA